MFRDYARLTGPPLGNLGSRERADLSAFVRERSKDKRNPPILSDRFLKPDAHDELGDVFRTRPPMSFSKRADKLLMALSDELPGAGKCVDISHDKQYLQAKAWALDKDEYFAICVYLNEVKWADIELHSGGLGEAKILPAGWERLEAIAKNDRDLTQGFVAMWFDPEMNRLYEEALFSAILCAGYTPIRIDKTSHAERIDHRIEVEIRQSKFLVADMTSHRGGVYFEAGFARALGRPFFYTCHKDDFDYLHFDTRQFNCLEWTCETLDKLKTDLRYSIENVCGRGPVIARGDECQD